MTGGESVATDLKGSDHVQWMKLYYGVDGNFTAVDEGTPLPVIAGVVDGLYHTDEDTSFVTGDSPVTVDVNAALGRDGRSFSVTNDGAGVLTVAVSNDGASFSPERTVPAGETFGLDGIRVDKVRLTWVTNTAYRFVAY